MTLESKFTKQYFSGIFTLMPEAIRPEGRRTFQTYDGLNNIFYLSYEMLTSTASFAPSRAVAYKDRVVTIP